MGGEEREWGRGFVKYRAAFSSSLCSIWNHLGAVGCAGYFLYDFTSGFCQG